MGVAYNSRIITDGLVLALDGGNTKSYPGILDNIVGWRLPSTNYIRGTLLDNDRTWSSEPSFGYSSVILNKTFNAGENFEVIAYWARDYRGIGMVYGPNVSIFDFTGYSADGFGPYFGALNTSGFPSGYSATFFGQYHSPIQGQGAQTTGYWFKWARTLNTLSLQYSATSSSGPWTNILADVSINSTDKVIIGAGEASSNEVSDLSLISVGPGPYTWTDLSGNGNNGNSGTLVNGVGYSSENGGSLVFDGNDDYADFFAPNLGTTTTVEMWARVSSFGGGMMFGWFYYDVYTPSGGLGYNTASSDVYGISAATVTSLGLVNTWKHYIFEMRSDVSYTNNKIYINGVSQSLSQQLSTENSNYRNFNSGNGRISGWKADNNYRLPMRCASFKVYNRALTQAEISQNFNALRGRFGI